MGEQPVYAVGGRGQLRVVVVVRMDRDPVLPAVLAVIEAWGGSGEELLATYLIGVEVASKVAEAINPRHYQDGFHSTGTVGTIGAGAGAAKGLGLDADGVATTFGLAASQAGGLRENFGTMGKPFHAGRAAESGVVAAQLSARGMTAAHTVLEAPRGFFQAAGGGFDPSLIDGRLGDPWVFTDPGISIKPHPSGSLTHPAMSAFLELVEEHNLRAEDVVRISVGTNSHMPNTLIHHRPMDKLEAKFSMEFCMAILLLKRRAGLAEFTDDVVRRDDVQALIKRVDFGIDAEAESTSYAEMTSIVRVELTDGSWLEAWGAHGRGHPRNPMSDEELTEKFLECLSWGGLPPDGRGEEVAERIFTIEHESSLGDVLDLLTR